MTMETTGTIAEAAGARARTAALPVKRGMETPVWQRVSGLLPEAEGTMSRSERRHALRKMFAEFERRIREALLDEAEEGERTERTFLWTPLESICFELGVARRKLSALTKELTGMSAREAVDRIRAERAREQIQEQLAEAARAEYAELFKEEAARYRKGSTPRVYEAWEETMLKITPERLEREKKDARAVAELGPRVKPPEGWDRASGALLGRVWKARRAQPALAWASGSAAAARQQWARELGFGSYNRLYRACLLREGKTPLELQHAAMVRLLDRLLEENAGAAEVLKEAVLRF